MSIDAMAIHDGPAARTNPAANPSLIPIAGTGGSSWTFRPRAVASCGEQAKVGGTASTVAEMFMALSLTFFLPICLPQLLVLSFSYACGLESFQTAARLALCRTVQWHALKDESARCQLAKLGVLNPPPTLKLASPYCCFYSCFFCCPIPTRCYNGYLLFSVQNYLTETRFLLTTPYSIFFGKPWPPHPQHARTHTCDNRSLSNFKS